MSKQTDLDYGPRPGQCLVCRFPDDDKLRRFGWQIYRRQKGREPLWRKGRRIEPQTEALIEVNDQIASAGKVG